MSYFLGNSGWNLEGIEGVFLARGWEGRLWGRIIGVLFRRSDGGIVVTLRIGVKRKVGYLILVLLSLRCLVGMT